MAAVMVRPPSPPNPKRLAAIPARLANDEFLLGRDVGPDVGEPLLLVKEPTRAFVGDPTMVADEEDVDIAGPTVERSARPSTSPTDAKVGFASTVEVRRPHPFVIGRDREGGRDDDATPTDSFPAFKSVGRSFFSSGDCSISCAEKLVLSGCGPWRVLR